MTETKTMVDFLKAIKTKKYFKVELADNNKIKYDVAKSAVKFFNRQYGLKNGVGYYEYVGNMPDYDGGNAIIGFSKALKTGVIWCEQDLFSDGSLRYWMIGDDKKRTGDFVDFKLTVTILNKSEYDKAIASKTSTASKGEKVTNANKGNNTKEGKKEFKKVEKVEKEVVNND